MKIKAFVKWLESQDQNLEVCVVEVFKEYKEHSNREQSCAQAMCFDDPVRQSNSTKQTLVLGVID